MAVRLSRVLQILVAVMVAAVIIGIEILSYGPNIDGQTPSLADVISLVVVEGATIFAFAFSAVALFRWKKLGWWLSIVLDGLVVLAAIAMVAGDFNDRFMVTQEGREAFRGDLIFHGEILVPCMVAIGLLLVARNEFLPADAEVHAPSPAS